MTPIPEVVVDLFLLFVSQYLMEFVVDLFGPKSGPEMNCDTTFWGQAAGGGWIYRQMCLKEEVDDFLIMIHVTPSCFV